jgi:flagellin
MSTRINTNVTAFSAARNLSANSDALSASIGRLSSGLRVSSAADDPAGLIISQNMNAQLVGLSQASSNTNDAINLVKTAEGALGEIQSLLTQVRQLAIHASNTGVNSAVDVQADQTQIASALQSINRIAGTTSFGTKHLLDGSANSGQTIRAGSALAAQNSQYSVVSQGVWASSTQTQFTSATLSQMTKATATFASRLYGDGTTTLSSVNTTFGGSVAINGKTYSVTAATPEDITQFNSTIFDSGYQASINGSGALVFQDQTAGKLSATPVINAANLVLSGAAPATLPGAPSAFFGTVSFAPDAGGTAGTLPTSSIAPVTAATPISVSGTLELSDPGTLTGDFSKTYTPGSKISQVQSDLDAFFGAGNVVIDTDVTGALTFSDFSNVTSTSTNFLAYNTATIPAGPPAFVNGTDPSLTLTDAGNAHTVVSTATQVGVGINYYSFANGLVLSSAKPGSAISPTSLTGSLTTTAGQVSTGVDLQFQLGAYGGQSVGQSIASVAADQLGKGASTYSDANSTSQSAAAQSVQDINVTYFKGAQDAIAVVDKAIADISTQRANLGSLQTNTLQSNSRSLSTASQNVQASKSAIVDTDLAAEIVNFTKDQILVQAGTSALAQANNSPQAILKLLQ